MAVLVKLQAVLMVREELVSRSQTWADSASRPEFLIHRRAMC
jgi:hypothetical protein